MKKILLLSALQLLCSLAFALNVTIIESQSLNSGHDMDNEWSAVLTSMGHNPTISPQTTLDNTSFFATTDILIVSSGIIALTAGRISTILQFLQAGKPVYMQCEYLSSYTTNQAYASLIASLGGSFNWVSSFSGNLAPVTVLGTHATTNTTAASLSYFWYSFSGLGDCNTVHFLEQGGGFHGFQYVPTDPCNGTIAATTDQDWIRATTNTNLMQNIITHLINPPTTCTPSSLCSLLPIKIVDFSATAVDYDVLLNWTTENESNSDFFTVEKTIDGVNFDFVGNIDATGISNMTLSYKLKDLTPFTGTSYYRLKQTNLNGVFEYSDLKAVEITGNHNQLNLYPNPVNGNETIYISFNNKTKGKAELVVRDYLGRILIQQNHEIVNGINTLQFPSEKLSKGVYIVSILHKNSKRKVKFVKKY